MEHKLTSLVHLPLEDKIDMSIFVIGAGLWNNALEELVGRHFYRIAGDIGPWAIIVGALTDAMHSEVVEKCLGKTYHDLKNMLPALFLTFYHADKLTTDSYRQLVPLSDVQNRYDFMNECLQDLAAFARNENRRLLDRLERKLSAKTIAQ